MKPWVLKIGLPILLFLSLPYLVGWAVSSPERTFIGSVYMQGDAFSYLAKMRLGARGFWLYHNPYAVEPHRPTLVYYCYLLAGHVAGLIGGPRVHVDVLWSIFHIWRVIAAVFLMWALARFYAALLPEENQQKLAYTLSLIGGGLGWLLVLVGRGDWLGFRPFDLYLGESYGYVALFALPHVAMARGFLLLGLERLSRAPLTWRDAVVVAVSWLFMTLSVAFYLLVAAGVVAVWGVLTTLRNRRIPWGRVVVAALGGLPGSALGLLSLLIVWNDPVYRSWNAQNLLPTPPLIHLAFAYGIPLALAAFGLRRAWRLQTPLRDLALAWPIAALILINLPLNIQARLVEGVHVALWGLAVQAFPQSHLPRAEGDAPISAGGERRWTFRIGTCLLVGIAALSPAFLMLGGAALPLMETSDVFLSADTVEALTTLNAVAPFDSVLLVPEPIGVLAPAWAGVRVVVGHGFETPDYVHRSEEVAAFYHGMTDNERRELLVHYNVRYLYCDPGTCADLDPAVLGFYPVTERLYEVSTP